MAFINTFKFAPAEWLPFQDRAVLDEVVNVDMNAYVGKKSENPDFELKIVPDVHNYFAVDLFQRIRMSDVKDEKLVVILPSPENAVFISVVENLNKFQVSARNVHVFFLYEYANEKGEVAPWASPFSRSGQFMKYFYNRLEEHLRMPMEQIHFWTKENIDTYSDLIAAEGGADVAYTTLSWSGGIGAIDAETFPADTMEEFLSMGSRYVKPMPEMLAHDSLRGMFGCSGDIAGVPPYAVTIGPKDLVAAKNRVHLQYLFACGGNPALQKFPLKLSLFGPICPKNPGSMMRILPGVCYIANEVAAPGKYEGDEDWLDDVINAIRKREEG